MRICLYTSMRILQLKDVNNLDKQQKDYFGITEETTKKKRFIQSYVNVYGNTVVYGEY